MKIRELLRLLFRPLIIICLLLIAQVFLSHYTGGRSKLFDYLMGIIDLREERTIGTWFETLLFAVTGLSFFVVSFHPLIPKFGKYLLMLAALGFCFLSADEALSLHEFMGYELEQATGIVKDTRLEKHGYSWVLLYGPGAIAVFGVLLGLYRRMLKGAAKKTAGICFSLAWVAAALIVICEAADGWSILERVDLSIVPCFEESFELIFLMLLYTANLLIAEKDGL